MAKEILSQPEYFELTGYGYNIMTQKTNRYDKFQIDLELTDPEQIAKAEEIQERLGLKIKDELRYSEGGDLKTKPNTSFVTLSRKKVEGGEYPCLFIPTIKADSKEPVKDLIKHGAKITVRIKAYGYGGGDGYRGGNGFQPEKVFVHEYEPYVAAA